MAKYGLNTNVLNSYISDFHGTTVELFQKRSPDQLPNKPLCIDCHGVHSILSTKNAQSISLQAEFADHLSEVPSVGHGQFLGCLVEPLHPFGRQISAGVLCESVLPDPDAGGDWRHGRLCRNGYRAAHCESPEEGRRQ